MVIYFEKLFYKILFIPGDKTLWDKVASDANNPLHERLPNKLERSLRPRGHNYELPLIRTERLQDDCLF